MSCVNALIGLRERLVTVGGLTVVKGVPDSIQKQHLLWVAYRGATNYPKDTRHTTAATKRDTWRFVARVYVSLQENELAEDAIVKYADSIPAAIWADPTLGTRANVLAAIEQSADGDDGYYVVTDREGRSIGRYRTITFLFDVIDKL